MRSWLLPCLLVCACNQNPGKKNIIHRSDSIYKPEKDTGIENSVVPTDTIPFNTSLKKLSYKTESIKLLKGDSFDLRIPHGFNISVAAQGLGRLRFLALSPDRRLFATDMYDRSDNKKGRLLIFDQWDESTGTFQSVITY